jgi:hypothetical protein
MPKNSLPRHLTIKHQGVFGAILASALLVGASAQTRPNLTGHWSFVAERSTGQPSYGSSVTIAQTESTLTLTVSSGELTDTVAYRLDGTETSHSPGTEETRSIATWSGNELTIITLVPAKPEEITRRLSLDAHGNLLVRTHFAASGRDLTSVYRR